MDILGIMLGSKSIFVGWKELCCNMPVKSLELNPAVGS